MIFEEVISKYNQLLKANGKCKSHTTEQKIIDLLENFLQQDDISNELKLWAFWNVSDNYAMQRKHEYTKII